MLSLDPKAHKTTITTSHTALHCVYWGHAAIMDIGYMTPIYGALLVLTIMVHILNEETE